MGGGSRAWLWWLLGALCIGSIAMHVPGALSMDSSLQVHEARTGTSVSWAPPFMSALLRWLGKGSPVATAWFVVLCASTTYASYALACWQLRRYPAERFHGWLRIACALVLVLNPLIFLHVGIVWKDVLFASLLALAAAMMLHASSGAARHAWIFHVLAIMLLLPTPLIRQHGALLAPLLILGCLYGLTSGTAGWHGWRRGLGIGLLALGCVAGYRGIGALVDDTIRASGDKSTSVGIAAIQKYDITGMLAAGADPSTLPGPLRAPAFLETTKRSYSADRLDMVLADPVVARGFESVRPKDIQSAWLGLVRQSPLGYARVKAEQYAWLIGLRRLDRCLPIHLGVEGERVYLEGAGFRLGQDRRDAVLFQLSMWTRHLALYRHWFYMVLLVACAVVAWRIRRRLNTVDRVAVASVVASGAVLYASFLPTVLACDFRYLYPGLVLVSVLTLYLLSHPATHPQLKP